MVFSGASFVPAAESAPPGDTKISPPNKGLTTPSNAIASSRGILFSTSSRLRRRERRRRNMSGRRASPHASAFLLLRELNSESISEIARLLFRESHLAPPARSLTVTGTVRPSYQGAASRAQCPGKLRVLGGIGSSLCIGYHSCSCRRLRPHETPLAGASRCSRPRRGEECFSQRVRLGRSNVRTRDPLTAVGRFHRCTLTKGANCRRCN